MISFSIDHIPPIPDRQWVIDVVKLNVRRIYRLLALSRVNIAIDARLSLLLN